MFTRLTFVYVLRFEILQCTQHDHLPWYDTASATSAVLAQPIPPFPHHCCPTLQTLVSAFWCRYIIWVTTKKMQNHQYRLIFSSYTKITEKLKMVLYHTNIKLLEFVLNIAVPVIFSPVCFHNISLAFRFNWLIINYSMFVCIQNIHLTKLLARQPERTSSYCHWYKNLKKCKF